MKKGFFVLPALFFSVLAAVQPAHAEDSLAEDAAIMGGLPRVADFADLLQDEEEAALADTLDEISGRQQADIVVVTVDSLDGVTAMEYADDFYDDNGYGFGDGGDGILFLVSLEERDWYMSAKGSGITAFTDAGLEYISEQVMGDLSSGEYAAAFGTFARLCDDFLTQAASGEPYGANSLPKGKFPAVFMLVLVLELAAAFAIALIVTGIMRQQLKSAGSGPAADSYVRGNSLRLTRETDLFLYRHVQRSERKQDSGNEAVGKGQ